MFSGSVAGVTPRLRASASVITRTLSRTEPAALPAGALLDVLAGVARAGALLTWGPA